MYALLRSENYGEVEGRRERFWMASERDTSLRSNTAESAAFIT